MHGSCPHNLFQGRGRLRLLAVWCAALLATWRPAPLGAEEASEREYKVKAAFVYNFLKFVVGGRFEPADGSAPTRTDPNAIILVGVLGDLPSKQSFAELRGKTIKDQRIQVRLFPGFAKFEEDSDGKTPPHPEMAEIRKCHVLFVCPSEEPFLARILPPLQREGMLLVGDMPGFLEAGGIINLRIEEKKVRFEINLAAAGRARLQIRSSLLRLAIRTMEHDQLERQTDEGKK